MNIRDLMVGDFVHSKLHDVDTFVIDIEGRVPKDQPELKYTEAVSVWLDSRQCWERHYLDEIEPIPLTAEILKKNGFEYYHKNFASLRYDHQFKLKMEKWPDENGLGGLWSITDLIKIRYVHELQQAMRMCSIEKEIIM